MSRTAASVLAATAVVLALLSARPARAQDLGHKIPGTLGLGAGNQSPPGVYVAERLAYLSVDRAFDRRGEALPIQGLDIDAVANALGVAVTGEIAHTRLLYTATVAVPVAWVHGSSERPEVSFDRYGLGDIYVQPVRLGWRSPHLDVVASYAFYAPTGWFEPGSRSGVGQGQWTHEFSLGGTVGLDRARTVYLSALASYDLNAQKRSVDITRGDTVQVQGGLGVRLLPVLDVGLVGYALWQVRDDRGADLPQVLRGAREETYGLGPEIAARIPALRAQASVRYEHDFAVRARPEVQLVMCSLTWNAWGAAAAPGARAARPLHPTTGGGNP